MAKIKNNPSKYASRASLVARKKQGQQGNELPTSKKREQEFITAPIDDNFYMDFRLSATSKEIKSR
jgi:hypothetical protein